ncbi:MAG: ABC transporter permease [Myxococcota bacterium]
MLFRGNKLLIFKMAWRNLWRHKRRTVITLFAMAVGLAFSIPTIGLMEGMSKQMVDGITKMHLGDLQIHQKDYPEEKGIRQVLPYKLITEIDQYDGVKAVAPRIYSGGMISASKKIESRIRGVDNFEKLKIIHGEMDRKNRCLVAVDEDTAIKYKLKPGNELILSPLPVEEACEKITIGGIFKGRNLDYSLIFMLKKQVKLIFASKDEVDDPLAEEGDDIDNFKKLDDAGGEEIGNSSVEDSDSKPKDNSKLKLGPAQGKYTFVRNYSQPVGVSAVEPTREIKVSNMYKSIISGEYLSNQWSRNKPDRVETEIIIGKKLAELLNVKVGNIVGMDAVTMANYPLDRLFKIKGIFKTGLDRLDRNVVYIHIENGWDTQFIGLRNKKKKVVHELAVSLYNHGDNSKVATDIRKELDDNLIVRIWQNIEPAMASIVATSNVMTNLILAIILIIAGFGTMNTMLMSVMERIKEFGVLKSIGMKPFFVATLILIETVFLTLGAIFIGCSLGLFFQSWLIDKGIDLNALLPNGFTFQGVVIDPVWKAIFTWSGLFIPIYMLIFVSLVVALWPALRAARVKPVEAFRKHK